MQLPLQLLPLQLQALLFLVLLPQWQYQQRVLCMHMCWTYSRAVLVSTWAQMICLFVMQGLAHNEKFEAAAGASEVCSKALHQLLLAARAVLLH
jgi:hypothetical protein